MALNQARVTRLFEFLQRHRSWNQTFQQDEYRRALTYCDGPLSRLKQLLDTIANSQSAPKLSQLGPFWRQLATFAPQGVPRLGEFTGHLERYVGLASKGLGPWDRLFHAMYAQPGWGPKTSALFVKCTIEIHRGPRSLHFLQDAKAARELPADDRVYLPVDAVITHVFMGLGLESANFQSINKALLENYSAEEMLVWDDLWYWGFFTQVSDGTKRTSAWNHDKFWCQLSAPKEQEAEVRRLGEEFIRICRGGRVGT